MDVLKILSNLKEERKRLLAVEEVLSQFSVGKKRRGRKPNWLRGLSSPATRRKK